jgi:hypothetical protein
MADGSSVTAQAAATRGGVWDAVAEALPEALPQAWARNPCPGCRRTFLGVEQFIAAHTTGIASPPGKLKGLTGIYNYQLRRTGDPETAVLLALTRGFEEVLAGELDAIHVANHLRGLLPTTEAFYFLANTVIRYLDAQVSRETQSPTSRKGWRT